MELIDLANQITPEMVATNPFAEVRRMVRRLSEIITYTLDKESQREKVEAGGLSRAQKWAEGEGNEAREAAKIQKHQHADWLLDQETSRKGGQPEEEERTGPRIISGGMDARSEDGGFGNR